MPVFVFIADGDHPVLIQAIIAAKVSSHLDIPKEGTIYID